MIVDIKKIGTLILVLGLCGCRHGEDKVTFPIDKSHGYILRQKLNYPNKEVEDWLDLYHKNGWKLIGHTHHGEYIFHKDKP